MKEEVPEEPYVVPIGRAAIESPGDDVTIVAYGAMMREARRAVTELAAAAISAELIDVRSLSPLDLDTVVASVRKTGRAVVVQEAPRTGGFAAEVVAGIQEAALYSLQAPVERVTGWDLVVPLRRGEHHHIPDAARILAAVRRTLEA